MLDEGCALFVERGLALPEDLPNTEAGGRLPEEAPTAYKDVERVVVVVHQAGLARKVARLKPLGIVKG